MYLQKTPLETAKISVFVFQDDSPLNGEHDAGGGVDMLAPNEAGLGGFNLVLLDKAGMFGDAAGQITYDMFGMPVSNSLAGTIDPATGIRCVPDFADVTDGMVGVIVDLPEIRVGSARPFHPLAGHAIIANMYAGLYEVVAAPGADRIARGEEWLQTNTLDGTKGIEAFLKPGEPGYFQEFGPGGYHVTFGFANPDSSMAARHEDLCRARRLHRQLLRQGHRTAHEPHARSAGLRQRQLRHVRLRAVLREPGRAGQRRFCVHQVRRRRATSSSPAFPPAT